MIVRYITRFLVGIALPFAVMVSTFIISGPEIVLAAVRILAFAFFIISFLFLIFENPNKHKNYVSGRNLFQWMDNLDDYDQVIMNLLKKKRLVYNTIDNLEGIKQVLMQVTKGDKKRLKMYREFYKQQLKQTGEELYLKTISVSLISVGLFVMGDFIPKIDQIELYIYIIIGILSLIAFISIMLRVNKKRIGLIISMIDLCIEDIEEDEVINRGRKVKG